MTYQHKEAFALMWYACSCSHRELIWNSRDGVTPFGGIRCPSCGGPDRKGNRGLSHVDWHLDETAPDHALRDGQRFFRDGTPDEAVNIMRRRIESAKGTRWEPPAELAERLLEAARNASEEGEFRKGWPTIDRWPVAS